MVAHGGLGHSDGQGEDHCGEHCPFLNRSDRRCSSCLSLDRIAHAFDYCFGEYKACPVYLEQLAERRIRRVCGLLTPPQSSQTDATRPLRPLVQLGTPSAAAQAHRYRQHAAGGAGISTAPSV